MGALAAHPDLVDRGGAVAGEIIRSQGEGGKGGLSPAGWHEEGGRERGGREERAATQQSGERGWATRERHGPGGGEGDCLMTRSSGCSQDLAYYRVTRV